MGFRSKATTKLEIKTRTVICLWGSNKIPLYSGSCNNSKKEMIPVLWWVHTCSSIYFTKHSQNIFLLFIFLPIWLRQMSGNWVLGTEYICVCLIWRRNLTHRFWFGLRSNDTGWYWQDQRPLEKDCWLFNKHANRCGLLRTLGGWVADNCMHSHRFICETDPSGRYRWPLCSRKTRFQTANLY